MKFAFDAKKIGLEEQLTVLKVLDFFFQQKSVVCTNKMIDGHHRLVCLCRLRELHALISSVFEFTVFHLHCLCLRVKDFSMSRTTVQKREKNLQRS